MEDPKKHAQQLFSRLCHDAGLLTYQIKRMTSDLEDLQVKLRNAEIDYKKASETAAHTQEATDSQGVTQ
jgi:hypothetical protein